MPTCHAKNMNEALKHNGFVFFLYNAELEIIIIIIITDKVQNQPRQWEPVKMFILGSLESAQAVHNMKWNWQSWHCSPGDTELAIWRHGFGTTQLGKIAHQYSIVWDMCLDVQFCTVVWLRAYLHSNQSSFHSILWCRHTCKHPGKYLALLATHLWRIIKTLANTQSCDNMLLKKKGGWILGKFWNLVSKNHFFFLSSFGNFFDKKIALTRTLFHPLLVTSNTSC